MESVTAKQLHLETKAILDQLENGEPLLITRNGQPVARLEPLRKSEDGHWEDLMSEVWAAQPQVKRNEIQSNPVLSERLRRRR
jgi:prevent-host-death family protein